MIASIKTSRVFGETVIQYSIAYLRAGCRYFSGPLFPPLISFPLPHDLNFKIFHIMPVLQSLGLTLSYVGVLYLGEKTRPSNIVHRDDPAVIKARVLAISLLTVAVVGLYIIFPTGNPEQKLGPSNLGLNVDTETFFAVMKSLGLTAVLFAAPLYDTIVNTPDWSIVLRENWNVFGLRNFIIGPITEEIVFRACIITPLDKSSWTITQAAMLSPLYFGVAHVHHAYEEYVKGQEDFLEILLTSAFQFLFTTIFGWYAAFLYLHFQTVYVPIAVHIFCNTMGVPEWPDDKIYRILLFAGLSGFIYLVLDI